MGGETIRAFVRALGHRGYALYESMSVIPVNVVEKMDPKSHKHWLCLGRRSERRLRGCIANLGNLFSGKANHFLLRSWNGARYVPTRGHPGDHRLDRWVWCQTSIGRLEKLNWHTLFGDIEEDGEVEEGPKEGKLHVNGVRIKSHLFSMSHHPTSIHKRGIKGIDNQCHLQCGWRSTLLQYYLGALHLEST